MPNEGTFVVHLIGSDEPNPFKHFRIYQHAVAYGRPLVEAGEAERVEFYFVPGTDDAAAAVAIVKSGNGKRLHSMSRHATDAQIEAHNQHVVSEALKAGPDAFLRLLGLLPREPSNDPKDS